MDTDYITIETLRHISPTDKRITEDQAYLVYHLIKTRLIVAEEGVFESCERYGEEVDNILAAVNEVLEGYGVEGIQPEGAYVNKFYYSTIGLYVNMGDTYAPTIVYDTEAEEFHLTSWGDFLENWQEDSEATLERCADF